MTASILLPPGLYPINGRDLELIAAVLIEWCGDRNRYECYLKVPVRGQPILCRPLDEMALIMFKEARLLPENLFPQGRRFPMRPAHLELVT